MSPAITACTPPPADRRQRRQDVSLPATPASPQPAATAPRYSRSVTTFAVTEPSLFTPPSPNRHCTNLNDCDTLPCGGVGDA
ncbi:hypothetical protein Franean1_0576 [Parafrankia sp. EAN1pec]|nr:hypothetical protein Franean1_0576 [Frankia sp. EAN1pec]